MLIWRGETRCLPTIPWTLAGAEDNACLGLSFPAATNQEKRQTKQWSCTSQLFHLSNVVSWQPVMTFHPKSLVILTRRNSLPFGMPGWTRVPQVSLQSTTWLPRPQHPSDPMQWATLTLKQVRLSNKLCGRFGHTVTLTLADVVYQCPLDHFVFSTACKWACTPPPFLCNWMAHHPRLQPLGYWRMKPAGLLRHFSISQTHPHFLSLCLYLSHSL